MHPLLRLLLLRMALGLATLLAVSLIIFFSVSLQPGDLAQIILGPDALPETIEALRNDLGLNLPAYQRYYQWIVHFLQGDLGRSLASKSPVSTLIAERLWNTLFLAGLTAVIAVPLAISLGIVAALRRNSWIDRVINITFVAAVSLPEFFMGYMVILIFALNLGLFPSLPQIDANTPLLERIYQCILPALTLTFALLAQMARMTRAAILNVLASHYVEMAHLKGLSPVRIVARHALPNALAPIINVVLLNLAYLVVGVVIVETVFAYPGLGQLLVDSVSTRDLPVVQSASLIFASAYVMLNIAADILSIVTNPRLLHPR